MRRRAASGGPDFSWARSLDTERNFWAFVLAASVLAVTLRLANVAAVARTLGYRQILDAAFYHDQARYLAGASATPVESGPIHFANPGYSQLLAGLYRVLGAEERVALTAQALCGGLTALILAFSARSLFDDRRTGVIAASLWALYGPAIYYDGVLLTPSMTALFTALALGAFAALLHSTRVVTAPNASNAASVARETDVAVNATSRLATVASRRALGWAFAAGLCVGVATWLRASNALLGFGFVGLLWFWRRRSQSKLRGVALALSFGAALVVTPGILRQHAESGEWVPVSANGGMNLWVGNNRDADGSYVPASFVNTYRAQGHEYTIVVERNAFLEEARRLTGDPELGLAASSAFWRGRALEDIFDDPPRFLGLELKKLSLFFNRYESWNNVSIYFLQHFSPILRFDPIGFGPIALLGSYGLLLLAESGVPRVPVVLLLGFGAPLVACLVFFASGEYRHPASVALVLGASFAIAQLSRSRARYPWSGAHPRATTLALAAVLALVCYPVARPGDGDNAKAYVDWLATVHPNGEKPTRSAYARAEVVLDAMSDTFMDRVLKNEQLLLVYLNRSIQFSDLRSAEQLIATASTLWQMEPVPKNGVPDYLAARVHDDLRLRVEQLGSQPFIAGSPRLEHELALLGSHDYSEIQAYLRGNHLTEARAFAEDALLAAPTSAQALAERGRVELHGSSPQAALPWLEKSLDAWPKIGTPAVLLAEYFLKAGSAERAWPLLREASARDPSDPELQELQRFLSQKPR